VSIKKTRKKEGHHSKEEQAVDNMRGRRRKYGDDILRKGKE